jgi:hypothetical protein
MDELSSLTSDFSFQESGLTQKQLERREYNTRYHKERRESMYKLVVDLNKKADALVEASNKTQTLLGERTAWKGRLMDNEEDLSFSVHDVERVMMDLDEVAKKKYKKILPTLSPFEQGKLVAMTPYEKMMFSLRH